jgi:hypothetical protein
LPVVNGLLGEIVSLVKNEDNVACMKPLPSDAERLPIHRGPSKSRTWDGRPRVSNRRVYRVECQPRNCSIQAEPAPGRAAIFSGSLAWAGSQKAVVVFRAVDVPDHVIVIHLKNKYFIRVALDYPPAADVSDNIKNICFES